MSRFAFFRQSGWMLIATVVSGGFMFLVHTVMMKPADEVPIHSISVWLSGFVRGPLTEGDYGLYVAMLSLITFLGWPSGGLQAIFSQQSAAVVSDQQLHQLRRSVRILLAATFFIWLACGMFIFVFQKNFLGGFKITDPATLWLTLGTGLLVLWTPILGGVLQGQQNFLWFGWSSIINSAGRCALTFLLVRVLGGSINSAMLSVFGASLIAFGIMAWQTSNIWLGPQEPFPWRPWLGRVVPLTVGLATTTFITQADAIFVRTSFPAASTDLYGAAGIIGRAIVFFTVPMTMVMFPKIVQSAARAERTDVMALALGATALLGACAATLCTILPEVPLKIAFGSTMLSVKSLVPWFAWCLLPLTLANVLINNLLARERFSVVPWLVIVALAYGGTLQFTSNRLSTVDTLASFKAIVRIIGIFSLVLLVVSAWFTWRTTEHGQLRSGKADGAA